MRLFLDNNLSPKIAHALHCLVQPEHEVIHLRDRFPANVSDAEWMGAFAKEMDWVIISADTAITRNPHEVEAWKLAGHPIFFLKHSLLQQTFLAASIAALPRFSRYLLYAWQRAHARATLFRSVPEEGSRAISLFEQKEPPAIIGSGFLVCSGRCISVWIVAGLPPIENLLVSPRDIWPVPSFFRYYEKILKTAEDMSQQLKPSFSTLRKSG